MSHEPIAERAANDIARLENAAGHTLEVAKVIAADAATDITDGAKQLRAQAANVNAQVSRAANEALEQATELTRAGIDHARDAAVQIGEDMRSMSARVITMVRTQPVTSMLVAAAGGAALVIVLRLLIGARARH